MTSIGNKNNKLPPNKYEIEVSVFGTGYGECILLHVGENNWFIVDSCINPYTREPIVINYLHQIGINPENAVKQVIATHWHDDHIGGLGDIVINCKSAEFVYSDALTHKEFLKLVELRSSGSIMKSSGVDEFKKVIDYLRQRGIKPKSACADRCIWKDVKSKKSCELYALSPSDASIYLSKLDIANLFPAEGDPKNRVMPLSTNHASVVLLFLLKDISILLGSDLEQTGKQDTGWTAILSSKIRPKRRSSVFKIPHHGSKTAYHPDVWIDMLVNEPYAVLTPFNKLSSPLPQKEDVDRICNETKNAFSTSNLKSKKSPKRSNTVEKTIKEVVHYIRPINSSIGHVRIRTKLNIQPISWNVELFGDAVPLRELYARI